MSKIRSASMPPILHFLVFGVVLDQANVASKLKQFFKELYTYLLPFIYIYLKQLLDNKYILRNLAIYSDYYAKSIKLNSKSIVGDFIPSIISTNINNKSIFLELY